MRETAYEPNPLTTSRHSENPSAFKINAPTPEKIPKNEPSHSKGDSYNLRPNHNPKY